MALWSLVLFGVRLTWAQLAGIVLSLIGVLTTSSCTAISGALAGIQFNKGDVMFAGALFAFGLYAALMPRRPKTHQLSLIAATTGCGALLLLPFAAWEYSAGLTLQFDALTVATVIYVVIFPSTLAYLFFKPRHRADRAEPRRAVLPSGAGVRLGDGDPAARRSSRGCST